MNEGGTISVDKEPTKFKCVDKVCIYKNLPTLPYSRFLMLNQDGFLQRLNWDALYTNYRVWIGDSYYEDSDKNLQHFIAKVSGVPFYLA